MAYTPKLTSTIDGKGIFLTYDKALISLHCDAPNECYWKIEKYWRSIFRSRHMMLVVPSNLVKNCNCELDSTPCGCTDPVPFNECQQCNDGFWLSPGRGCKSKYLQRIPYVCLGTYSSMNTVVEFYGEA